MDDRMQTCPNCGEAVPAAARFCVTCGIRLPEPAPNAGSPGPASRSGWSQPGEDVWIGEAPARNDDPLQSHGEEPPPSLMDDHPPSEEAGEMSRESAETALTGDLVTTEEDEVIALPPAEHAGQPANMADLPDSAIDEQSLDAPFEPASAGSIAADVVPPVEPGAWPAHHDDAAGADIDVETTGDEPEASGERVGPEGELAGMTSDNAGAYEADPIVASGPADQERHEPDQTGAVFPDDEALNGDDFDPAGWTDDDEAMAVTGDPSSSPGGENGKLAASTAEGAESAGPATTVDQSPTIERAGLLLDELRKLLPQLAAPIAPSTPDVNLNALREQAVAARGETSFDNFSALRAAIVDAVSRPRDIEVVLRLSQRIDDIDALLKEYDRLRTGFDAVIAELGQ